MRWALKPNYVKDIIQICLIYNHLTDNGCTTFSFRSKLCLVFIYLNITINNFWLIGIFLVHVDSLLTLNLLDELRIVLPFLTQMVCTRNVSFAQFFWIPNVHVACQADWANWIDNFFFPESACRNDSPWMTSLPKSKLQWKQIR